MRSLDGHQNFVDPVFGSGESHSDEMAFLLVPARTAGLGFGADGLFESGFNPGITACRAHP